MVFNLLLFRAIYDCIESAFLWFDLLSTTIEGLVFENILLIGVLKTSWLREHNVPVLGTGMKTSYRIKYRGDIKYHE